LGGEDGAAVVYRQPGVPTELGFALDAEGRIKTNNEV